MKRTPFSARNVKATAPELCAAVAADMAAVQKMALRLIGTSFAQTLRSPTSSITDLKSFDSRIEVTSNVLKF